MSEEFQGGVCGGSSWWINPSTNLFRSSPCASAITAPGSFEWLSHDQPKTTSDDSGSTGSLVLNMDHEDNWNQNLMMDDSNHIFLQQSYSTNTMDNINNYSSQFSSYGSYDNSSPVFQTLFNADSQPHQQLDQSTNYLPCPEYLSPAGFRPNKIDSNLHFANDAAFWNGKAPNFLPPNPQPQSVLRSKPKRTNQELKKGSNEPSAKRTRMEAPSPLPTIKVRKEKLGDRITALQQLVSPFGKTDTASVLHEAIEYIKFLHEQVGVLSTPYLKNGSNRQHDHQRARDETRDLRSLGLCLVPIPATFPVAGEASADFWTPTFGGCFR